MHWILAFDHRNSFRTGFLGLTGPPTAADEETCRHLKAIIAGGLVTAIEEGIPDGEPAALVDAEYGVEAIRLLRRHDVAVAVPVEASGRAELEFEHGDQGFGPALAGVGARWAKVLVRYNPQGDPDVNRRQRDRMLTLQEWCRHNEHDVMLELLVPPEKHQLSDGLSHYDDELRPALTVRAVTELTADGLSPALWKLEGMPSSDAYAAIAVAGGADRPDGPRCVVLGRGADPDAVDEWLTLAAPVPGFDGFAVGRTLWWDALRSHLDGEMSAAEASSAISANYRRLIDVYLHAAT